MGKTEEKAKNTPKPVTEAKPVVWIGSSKKDLLDMPKHVVSNMGFVLSAVQYGEMPEDVSPFDGSKANNILKIKEEYDKATYRLVFAAKFEKVVYVLHAFQKKSSEGKSTPQKHIDLVEARYKQAQQHYRDNYENNTEKANSNGTNQK